MKQMWLIPFVAAALLTACADQSERAPAVDRETALAELDALRAQFEEAVAAGDMAALGALVSPDAVILQPGAADWKAMQQLAAGAPFPQGAQIEITPLETVIVNERWAFERGASLVTYTDPESGDEIALRDAFLVIFRNDGEGWRLYREVASASEPPEGWPEAQ